jgi:hypothetical protein
MHLLIVSQMITPAAMSMIIVFDSALMATTRLFFYQKKPNPYQTKNVSADWQCKA